MKILLTQGEYSCDSEKVYSEKEKILTLVNNFSYEIPTIINEKEFSDPEKVKSLMPIPGILLSTSGSGGEKKWILHPWNNLRTRIKKNKSPTKRCLIFLSVEHAAGIEGFFSHYLNGVDCGIFSPSLSVAEVLRLLTLHQPLALSTTSSTFLRFISYPALRHWIKEYIQELNLGGEDIDEKLQEILRSEFSHIKVKSIYGTTETWSLSTDQSSDLNWHSICDLGVEIDLSNNNLSIYSPYLFSHFWDGEKFIKRENDFWQTGDWVEINKAGEFKIKTRRFMKYHGLKVFPDEWEMILKKTFGFEWAHIQENNDSFTLTLPLSYLVNDNEIRNVIRENNWPIKGLYYNEGPIVTSRGKRAKNSWVKITSEELRSISKENFKFSYLESYTWNDDSDFMFYRSSSGFLFYKINPCRLSLQYCLNNVSELEGAFNLIYEELIIRLPSQLNLDLSLFKDLGVYYVWELDLLNWGAKVKKPLNDYSRHEFMENKFDSLLKGKEKQIVSTLSDSIVYHLKREDSEGLCAFRIVDDSYYGIYLSNNHLPMRDFWQLCTLGLVEAKNKGAKKAIVRVDENNSSAKFIHEVLGFVKSKDHYRLWSNKINE